ncbi:hypothetical protein LNO36_12570 [Klebsiella variicola subsp. variicola]|nr:hypothetical protein [Klebsiella variicola subsp. variicola]
MFFFAENPVSQALSKKRRAEKRCPHQAIARTIPGRRDNDAAGRANVACAPAARNMTGNYAVARSFQLSE